MEPVHPVEAAKERLHALVEREPWFMGLSVALVGDAVGLVLMVEAGHEDAAQAIVDHAALSVPVEVRGMGPIDPRDRGDPA